VAEKAERPAPAREFPILLEDEHVIALDKPAGVSMATSGRPGKSEEDVVARLLAACGADPEPRPLLVHRLDEGTSGVVVLARDAAAHRALTRAFQERAARKTYRALVWGHPVPARGVADAPLGRDARDGRRMAVRADGKAAVTRWTTLRRYPSVADLEVAPETGRTHQIRVHMAHIGHPLIGDRDYGGGFRTKSNRLPDDVRKVVDRFPRQALHAGLLAFAHPASGEVMEFKAPLPADMTELIAALRTL